LTAAMYAGRLGEPDALPNVAEAARAAVGRVPNLHRPIDLLLSGLANLITSGTSAATGPLRAALEQICHAPQSDGQPLRLASLGLAIVQENAAGELWDDAIWHQLASNLVTHARDAGALAVLPPALVFLAGIHVYAG